MSAPRDGSGESSARSSSGGGGSGPPSLGGAQKRRLRGLAHALRPVVEVGRAGVGERVLREVEAALEHHELIKVRLGAEREERKVWAREIAAATDAALIAEIGSMAVLFRAASDPERRRIVI